MARTVKTAMTRYATLGENGNWWIGNVDTGVPAKGQDGKPGDDGQMPDITIGENGNGILTAKTPAYHSEIARISLYIILRCCCRERYALSQSLDDDGVKCECVVTDEGNGVLEMKNIATEPGYQGKGYGKALLDFVAAAYKGKYSVLQVGHRGQPADDPFLREVRVYPFA